MLISTLRVQAQVAAPTALEQAADVASIVIAVAVLVLVTLGAALLLKLNRVVSEMRLGVRQNLGPVSDRARSITDNVEFISQALRTDVERLNESVQALTERLHLASERMEERVEEFNALMEVVQGEAEEIFLDTASTVRGVREGARSIARGPREDVPGEEDDSEEDDSEANAAEAEAPNADASEVETSEEDDSEADASEPKKSEPGASESDESLEGNAVVAEDS